MSPRRYEPPTRLRYPIVSGEVRARRSRIRADDGSLRQPYDRAALEARIRAPRGRRVRRLPRPARRPRFVVLATIQDPQILLPSWEEGVAEFAQLTRDSQTAESREA